MGLNLCLPHMCWPSLRMFPHGWPGRCDLKERIIAQWRGAGCWRFIQTWPILNISYIISMMCSKMHIRKPPSRQHAQKNACDGALLSLRRNSIDCECLACGMELAYISNKRLEHQTCDVIATTVLPDDQFIFWRWNSCDNYEYSVKGQT